MFLPMTDKAACEILSWEYPGEYAIYNAGGSPEEALAELMNGSYYVSLDEAGRAAGFVCFGPCARIPAAEEDAYDERAVDIGLGRRPDLCGRGDGRAYFAQVMALGRALFPGETFRLTVACFNQRAIKVYMGGGFIARQRVSHRLSGGPFVVMVAGRGREDI